MNVDKMIKRASSMHSSDRIALKDGMNKLRFVSPPGDEEPWREVMRHFLPKEYRLENFTGAPLCLGTKECPGCQLVEKFRAMGQDTSADKVKAQRRYIFLVFSRDFPNNEMGELAIKIVEVPPTVFQGLAKVAQEWDDFTHPDTGYDIQIMRTTGPFTKYEVSATTQRDRGSSSLNLVRTPLSQEELRVLSESCPDLDKELEPPDIAMFSLAAEVRKEGDFAPGSRFASESPNAEDAKEEGVECPVFGEDYDETASACRSCSSAETCKTKTEERRSRIRRPV